MCWLWPRSLRGQMIMLVLVGLALAQGLGYAIYRFEERSGRQALRDEFVLTRVVSVARLLADTPQTLHARVLNAASSRSLRFSLSEQPTHVSKVGRGRPAKLRERLAAMSGRDVADIQIGLGSKRWKKWREHKHKHDVSDDNPSHDWWKHEHDDHDDDDEHFWEEHPVLVLATRLGPDRWLNATSVIKPPEPFFQWPTLFSVGLAALILSALIVVTVNRITQSLGGLASAAERFGRGEDTEPLAERGPEDVRGTIRAFNHMRDRLDRFVRDRTQMLAAISHDLRTPIAALRVRAELIEASETRARILATLDEMQRMTEATLAFAREDADQEETRLVDLHALIDSVCNDLGDAGAEVEYRGPGRITYRCRSTSLGRALRNLIENAVRYGERARVMLTEHEESLRIQIEDDGPGIAESDRERVFELFVRLESSRSRETGGVGLGLAIARTIVHRHGGDIRLENRQKGGLRASIVLPIAIC